MKVIFLDVDGVLVHKDTIDRGRGEARSWKYLKRIDDACIEELIRALEATHALVVVSSTWRINPEAMVALRKAFRIKGAPFRRSTVLDITPVLEHERSAEIQAWLNEHPDVESYVVLDDTPVEGHPLVHVAYGYEKGGMKAEHADQIIQILGEKSQ
jgi:hypothetical protein